MSVAPAPLAANVACARVLVLLRGLDDVAGLPRNEVTSQSTAAWGGGEITLTCGLPALPPTTSQCETVTGVDWVITQSSGRSLFTTFGRDPAVQVSLAGEHPRIAAPMLTALGPAAASLPSNGRKCI